MVQCQARQESGAAVVFADTDISVQAILTLHLPKGWIREMQSQQSLLFFPLRMKTATFTEKPLSQINLVTEYYTIAIKPNELI